jgi:hypothetical protein
MVHERSALLGDSQPASKQYHRVRIYPLTKLIRNAGVDGGSEREQEHIQPVVLWMVLPILLMGNTMMPLGTAIDCD